jgi:branched-chain amino acid transport system substrate-binding protein
MTFTVRFLSITATALALAVALGACQIQTNPAEERSERAATAEGPIIVGAAWPWRSMKGTFYQQGMNLAVEEVNANGGVSGRPIKIVQRDDKAQVNEARLVAQTFSENYNMVAVIGHLHSFTTVPAASIYDRAGMLLLAPTATDPELTRKGYPLVFRSTFDNEMIGRKLGQYVAKQGYQRIGVCYVGNEYGRELANAFEMELTDRNIPVVSRQGYSAEMRTTASNVDRIIAEWKSADVDVIFLAGEVPVAPMLMAAAREAGIEASFVGGDALRIPRVIEMGGAATEGLVVPYEFHPEELEPKVQAFVASFRDRFGVDPDAGAALGYDSIHLLAESMTDARSTVPADVAAAMRTTQWKGVTGVYRFDEQGNRAEVNVKLMNVVDQEFVPLSDSVPQHASASPASPLSGERR